ncbi:MAG: hypothetical protein ABSE47_08465 [Acidimicrobiales bacterium]
MNRTRLQVTWPLFACFAWYPVWWVLGVSSFIWPIFALPILVTLLWRRWTRVPAPMILWFLFLSWVLLSGVQITSATRWITFGYRFSLYAAGSLLFAYVYNMPRDALLDSKVLRALTSFWMVVVGGGYLGILFGGHTFTPPFERILPHGLRANTFVQELVQPVFAQVQAFLGFPIPRPAAPFTYTNLWGGAIAVLTPVAFATIASTPRGTWRKIVICVLVASVVPMTFSLNRGMFLSLGIGVLYVTVRLAMRGRIASLVTLVVLAALSVTVVSLTPLGHLILASFSSTHGHSNATRVSLSQQAISGASSSPWFGYGSPQPVVGQAGSPAIGTQGQLWTILYSNGYPAAFFFVAFFLAVMWQTRRAAGTAGLWLHAVPLIGLTQIIVYGWLPAELQVVMVAAALAYRRSSRSRSGSVVDAEHVPVSPPEAALAGAGRSGVPAVLLR